METASSITNDFRDFQLWNLAGVGGAALPSAPRGPYMVVQDGCAPTDPVSRKCSFVLTRRGTWLHCFLFFMLPESVRHGVGIFDSIHDVVALSEGLIGKARVESANSVGDLLTGAGYELSSPAGQAVLAHLREFDRPEPPSGDMMDTLT
jgi:hypothetical protein